MYKISTLGVTFLWMHILLTIFLASLEQHTIIAKTESVRVTTKFKFKCNEKEWSKLKTLKTKIVEYEMMHNTLMSKR